MGLLDRSDFCSLFVGADDFYLNKLVHSHRTWVMLKPEILRMPQVFVIDARQLTPSDVRWNQLCANHEEAVRHHTARGLGGFVRFAPKFVPWRMDRAESQRERMLTGLVRCTDQISTPWYLKLDADTFAHAPGGWYYDRWFSGNPCYISSPWGYTKPGGTVEQMNRWAATVPQLKSYPEVTCTTVTMSPGRTKDNHARMASWVMFGNTEWSRWASGLCQGDRLPFPSQDTYLSYVQARTGKAWVPMKWRHYGWEHQKNPNGLRESCLAALKKVTPCP